MSEVHGPPRLISPLGIDHLGGRLRCGRGCFRLRTGRWCRRPRSVPGCRQVLRWLRCEQLPPGAQVVQDVLVGAGECARGGFLLPGAQHLHGLHGEVASLGGGGLNIDIRPGGFSREVGCRGLKRTRARTFPESGAVHRSADRQQDRSGLPGQQWHREREDGYQGRRSAASRLAPRAGRRPTSTGPPPTASPPAAAPTARAPASSPSTCDCRRTPGPAPPDGPHWSYGR